MESFRDFVSDNLLFFFLLAIASAIAIIAIGFHLRNIRIGKMMLKKSNIATITDDYESQF